MNLPTLQVSALNSLVPLVISGADARTFLQGQLSNDLRKLTPERALLASCNSARGRVQTVLTLLERDDGIVALTPTAMAKRLLTRLRTYVLRSKVAFVGGPEYLLAPRRHCRGPAAGLSGNTRALRRADVEPGPVERHQLRQRLLYRPGDHRPHAFSRHDQTPHAALHGGVRGALPRHARSA